MPEGPELNLSAKYVNLKTSGVIFSDVIRGKAVSVPRLQAKYPEIEWKAGKEFTVSAKSRGKEFMLTIHPIKSEESKDDVPINIFFHFGMSGKFVLVDPKEEEEASKHAHLRFTQSQEQGGKELCFCDQRPSAPNTSRRFGNWKIGDEFDSEVRGPCIINEYPAFRRRVIEGLDSEPKMFAKPINEVLLNQKYFNGVGNYLRAEIMCRANVSPFTSAAEILSQLTKDTKEGSKEIQEDIKDATDSEQQANNLSSSTGSTTTTELKSEQLIKQDAQNESTPTSSDHNTAGQQPPQDPTDILWLCHKAADEVVKMAETNPEMLTPGYGATDIFWEWMTCYYQKGSLMKPSKGSDRTLWYRPEQVRKSSSESMEDIIARETKNGSKLKMDKSDKRKLKAEDEKSGKKKAKSEKIEIKKEDSAIDSDVPLKRTRSSLRKSK